MNLSMYNVAYMRLLTECCSICLICINISHIKTILHASILDTCRSARDAAYKKVFVCFENAVVLVCVCVRLHDV